MIELNITMEPAGLSVLAVNLDYPQDGTPGRGSLTLAGDARDQASRTGLSLRVQVVGGQTFTWGPLRGLGSYRYAGGETVIQVIQEGGEPETFTPIVGATLRANLEATWPGLQGLTLIPDGLLDTPVAIPLAQAVEPLTARDWFAYLLGGLGYTLAREQGVWRIVGGARADHTYPHTPVADDSEVDEVDTLTLPQFITVRGRERETDTPPPETGEQRQRRERVAALLAEALQSGQLTESDQFELAQTGRRDRVLEETTDIQPGSVGYTRVTDWLEKDAGALTGQGSQTVRVSEATLVEEGAPLTYVTRSTDTTGTSYRYGLLGTRRVSTGSTTTHTVTQQLLTAPTVDPPLDLDAYSTVTTTDTRKFWDQAGYVSRVVVRETTDSLRGQELLDRRVVHTESTWTRTGDGRWATVTRTLTPYDLPQFDGDGNVVRYLQVMAPRTSVSADAPPPETAPQTDDGLRGLTPDGEGVTYTVTPEAIGGTGGYGDPVVLSVDWLDGQAAVDAYHAHALQLLGGPQHERTRVYVTPVGARRGGAVRAVSVSVDQNRDDPYQESVTTTWTD